MSTDLSPIHRHIDRVHAALESQVSRVDVRVGHVANDVANTTKQLQDLRERFEEYVLHAERTANIQRSETKLGTLKDDLDREYGHYAIVRRSSIGTLQAFDIGNVTNKTVQQVSEELMIQTPRYWLAPALVALAAWSRDDPELAGKSVDAAFSRDSAKTSLFFALVLRRQRRLVSASRWLEHYFSSLDPRSLTRDFAVVLEGAAQEAFGPDGRELVLRHLVEWENLLRNDPEIVEAQISAWVEEIAVMRGVIDDSLYPTLVSTCPQWPALKDLLEHASAHGTMSNKYQAILDLKPVVSGVLEDRMDELLEGLVTEYDAEELPLRREIVYHESVLESGGDLDRARQAADSIVKALDESLDAVTLSTHAALHPRLLGISEHTQKLAIGAGKADFRTAIGRYSKDYRQRAPQNLEVVLGPTHSGFAAAFGFNTWSTRIDTTESEAQKSLSDAWDKTLSAYVEQHRFKQSTYVIASLVTLGVALLLGFITIGAGFWLGLLIGLVVGGGISALVVWRKMTAAKAAVAKAEAERDTAKEASIQIYRDATAEYTDASLVFADEDAKEADLVKLVEAWPSFSPAGTAKESN